MDANVVAELSKAEGAFRDSGDTRHIKKWMRIKEATQIYSIGRTKLTALAKECGATLKIDKLTLIDTERLEIYLETFRLR